MQIKFSHNYPKLHGQLTARLESAYFVSREDMHPDFIEYDTVFSDGDVTGHYPLPPADYMVLVFTGDKMIPFTTARRFTPEKAAYYKGAVGKRFDIVQGG